ncbi:MAG: zf-HC2 domain-containing protein [Chloroflexota bacterium]|nr:zf-HC2 domain-containing protein [Chloroflexota bacterium]
MVHISAEELSALLDGELSAQAELRARQHLAQCAFCSADYALSVRLDDELRQPPVLACAEVLEVLSAGLDRETSEDEQAVAQRHLAGCQDCHASVEAWSTFASAIKGLPVIAPSSRIDDAIYAIARSRRTYAAARARGIAARALIAVTAVFAIIVASLGTGVARPQTALLPNPTGERAIVASIQQIVFNSRNNTLYVLDAPGAAVDARDPGTNDLKTRIQVGGKPTALALNQVANRVLVLDASQKRVTEIDAANNTVIGTTTVAVTGTPTSISVDPATNNILVTSTSKSPAAPGAAAGSVAVINSDTKQLETIREITVAPRLVVPDQRSGRSLLVSADITQLVDSSYKVIATLPGGVSAAFSKRSDNVAVLSASGADSVLTFAGFSAPDALKLTGLPRALTALPDGGYLVLADLGGRGRVSRITREGATFASTEVAVTGGDLIYDESTNRFTVANNGRLDTAQMPDQVATTRTTSPTQTATNGLTSPSPSVTPSESPQTSAPSPSAAPTIGPNLLAGARVLTAGLYNLPLPNGINPQFVAANGSRLWLLDQSNNVSAFDMSTGDLFNIGPLRKSAKVDYWVAGGSYVFGVNASNGEVNIVNVARERVEGGFATNVLSPVSAVAVGIDGRLWIGLRDASYMFVFDPKTHLMNGLDLKGARVNALTVDGQGRIFFADDARGTVGTIDPRTSLLNEVSFVRPGATTALLVDSTSTLWVGTSTGEIYSVRGGTATLTLSLRRPVSAFAPDQAGHAWYLAQLPSGLAGYAYAPADGSREPRSVSGPAQSLNFSPIGRAFLADPRGGFYMSVEGGR